MSTQDILIEELAARLASCREDAVDDAVESTTEWNSYPWGTVVECLRGCGWSTRSAGGYDKHKHAVRSHVAECNPSPRLATAQAVMRIVDLYRGYAHVAGGDKQWRVTRDAEVAMRALGDALILLAPLYGLPRIAWSGAATELYCLASEQTMPKGESGRCWPHAAEDEFCVSGFRLPTCDHADKPFRDRRADGSCPTCGEMPT